MSKPMVSKPFGPSELGKGFGTDWNNLHWGTDGPVTCEICGTEHPERKDETYTLSQFLGRVIVEECCGAMLDLVYNESGEVFTRAFLEEFAENPTNPCFLLMLDDIKSTLQKAGNKLAESKGKTEEALRLIEGIQKR